MRFGTERDEKEDLLATGFCEVLLALQSFLNSQGVPEALTWQRLLWQKQLENVLRLKHRQINITRVGTNDLHFEMPEAHSAS